MVCNYIPGTAQEIIEKLMVTKNLSIKELAKQVGVSIKTIYRIRQGLTPLPKTHLGLIQLYLRMKAISCK